jgi:hypothetical protein
MIDDLIVTIENEIIRSSFIRSSMHYLAKSIVNPNDRSIGLKKLP